MAGSTLTDNNDLLVVDEAGVGGMSMLKHAVVITANG